MKENEATALIMLNAASLAILISSFIFDFSIFLAIGVVIVLYVVVTGQIPKAIEKIKKRKRLFDQWERETELKAEQEQKSKTQIVSDQEFDEIESDLVKSSTVDYLIAALAFDNIALKRAANDTKLTETSITILVGYILAEIFAFTRDTGVMKQFQYTVPDVPDENLILALTLALILTQSLIILSFYQFINLMGGTTTMTQLVRVYGLVAIWQVFAALSKIYTPNLTILFQLTWIIAFTFGASAYCKLSYVICIFAGLLALFFGILTAPFTLEFFLEFLSRIRN